MALQKTLKHRISCSGVGLHSGAQVTMTLNPAPADSGIVFRRTDIDGEAALLPAHHDTVVDVRMCTTIGNEQGVTVGTVEHLIAAFAGCELDNVLVELDGPEVPVMDGSSSPFVFLIECAGLQELDAPRRYLRILKEVEVTDGDKRAVLMPGDNFSISFDIDFDSAAIGRQSCCFDMRDGAFKTELARARTFGFAHEVEQLKDMGLARGGSLDNAVVVEGDEILNEEGLRYRDEFVRHKALDSVGDLYLAGAPILGRFYGLKSGHALNNHLLKALLADKDAWCFTTEAPVVRTSGGPWPESRAAAPVTA